MQRVSGSINKIVNHTPKSKGKRSASNVPLYEVLPGFENVKNVGELRPPQFQSTTLSSGVRVITVSTQQPTSSVGLFINAGSRHENADNAGAAFFMKHLGFKSSQKITPLRLVRSLELLGANYSISCGREHMMYASELPAENVPELVPIIAEALHPALKEYEVRDEAHKVEDAVREIESNPRAMIFEILHQEAYRNQGLGNTLYAPTFNLHNLTPQALGNFVNSRYAANNVVLVGTGGVKHEELVKAVEKHFSFGQRTSTPTASSPYLGGESRIASDFETYFGVAFEGAKLNSADKHALGILQFVLGGGTAYYTGGIGYGLSSRLNKRVVEPNGWVHEASAFNFNYSDSGLFGVLGIAQRGNVSRLADLITRELSGLGASISNEEFARARNIYKGSIAHSIESSKHLLEFVGRNAVSNGEASPEQIFKSIDAITADQVVNVAKRVLKSKPTLAVLGDIRSTPTIDQIRSSINF